MKRSIIIIIFLFLFLLPINVKAEQIYTTIVGNDKIEENDNIKYTVIVDKKLTNYSAEISYDKAVLNLVSVNEVKIDTNKKYFVVNRSNPITVGITSKEESIIVYEIVFNVKRSISTSNTSINITTINAVSGTNKYETDNKSFEMVLTKIEKLNVEKKDDSSSLNKTMKNIKSFFNNNISIIMFASLVLNGILIIGLIISIMRKKVDYDF